MRGEYSSSTLAHSAFKELPPRARRILACETLAPLLAGTTSACAENTSRDKPRTVWRRNYLRVRGEYSPLLIDGIENMELPPRARRIHRGNPLPLPCQGTTSACAENTDLVAIVGGAIRNYLRVRGEYV